jgi:hypothetical protein
MIFETAAIVSVAKPLVEKFVSELITPKITQFADKCKLKYNELLIPKGEHFEDYLIRTYDKYSCINALAIPNSQFQLKDVYVTQNLIKENRFESEDEVIMINQLPTKLIKKYKKILITDTAGMGKSTIMKYMFVDLIDNCIKDVGIPIFIELNRPNKNRTILAEIQEELNSLSKEFDKDLLLNFIQKGGFIFFLDGYDEISIADRSEVTKDIQTFISKAGTKNFYVLASRPEDSLASFGDFQSFKIQPLTKNEAFELLTKYDLSSQNKISKELIKELKTSKYDSIDEYLVNPLLVSLLFIAYNYKSEIPLKKHQFYRQVYDALFNSHKLAQGQKPHEKRSGLDIDDFNRVLRYVGYECLIRIGVQFDEDTILNSIKRAKVFSGNLKFGDSDFLKDLMTSVPLFVKDGIEYKWAHKSLMEYFAARFIAEDVKENQDKILTKIYNSEDNYKYINMLDIYCDIDYKGFSRNIVLPFLEMFVKYHDEQYPASFGLDKDILEARIALLYPFRLSGILRNNYFKQRKKRDKLEHSFFYENVAKGERWFGTFYGYYDDFVMMGFQSQESNKYEFLSRLVFIKYPELFIQNKTKPKKIDKSLYKEEMIYKIDILTGNNDIYHFQLINTLLSKTNHLLNSCYFNYDAVKRGIQRIKKEIELSKHQFELLPE